MKYPIPTQEYFFYYNNNIENKKQIPREIEIKDQFSRPEKDPLMEEYIQEINKYENIFKSIPFVSEIYLCNSITFNKLNENSDIDLFIITNNKSIRRARFFSLLIFWLKWIKVWSNNKSKKFCLSFYVTENNLDIYNISLPKTDIYLAYWLAHLVPLYSENKASNTNIYHENNWLKALLPNFPNKHIINIWNKKIYWNSNKKNKLEYFFWNFFFWISWLIIENLIKLIRYPILIIKKRKLWPSGKNIVISDTMLKFHKDIRKKVRLLFTSQSKKK